MNVDVGLLQMHGAKALLNDSLTSFFAGLTSGNSPRLAVRITMGTGKTTKALEHLRHTSHQSIARILESMCHVMIWLMIGNKV